MPNRYSDVAFPTLPLSSSSELPPLALIALDNQSLVTATGDDKVSYLQGQLTCDLVSLDKGASTLAAHCDAKGKVWSVIRLFNHLDGLAYLQPKSVNEKQLSELKKYAIFSKIKLEESSQILLGMAGSEADEQIDTLFPGNTAVRATRTGSAVRVEPGRWVLAIDEEEATSLFGAVKEKAELSDSALWDLYETLAAMPKIELDATNEHIPQAINLQALDGISFKKGCYTGQETVARAKYRGINKRAMFLLAGQSVNAPRTGDVIERSVGENWRSGGTVLSGYRYADGHTVALAVLPNNLDADSRFRLAGEPESEWEIQPLPYSLDEE